MEIRDLWYFSALAESGNYLDAALDLGIAQSTLSKRIMALETELGATLVDRSKRKIAITEAGVTVLSYSRRMLSAHQDMKKELARPGTALAPVVTIRSVPVLAAYDIPSLLARLRKTEPAIELRVIETEAKEILPALLNGDADLGIMRGAFVDTARFEYAPLYDDEAVAVLPNMHPLCDAGPLDLMQLRTERFILMGKQTLQLDFFVARCLEHGFKPEIVHTSTHADNVLNMVASGLGVSLLPRRIAEFPKGDGISIVPLRDRIAMGLGIAWLKSDAPAPSLKRLLQKTGCFQLI